MGCCQQYYFSALARQQKSSEFAGYARKTLCMLHLALNLIDIMLILDLCSDYKGNTWSVKCLSCSIFGRGLFLCVFSETNTNHMISISLPVAPSAVQEGKKKLCRDIDLNLQRKWYFSFSPNLDRVLSLPFSWNYLSYFQ